MELVIGGLWFLGGTEFKLVWRTRLFAFVPPSLESASLWTILSSILLSFKQQSSKDIDGKGNDQHHPGGGHEQSDKRSAPNVDVLSPILWTKIEIEIELTASVRDRDRASKIELPSSISISN
jgi:hypothetical protein